MRYIVNILRLFRFSVILLASIPAGAWERPCLAPGTRFEGGRSKVGIYFSWQTFGTLLKQDTIFPRNPGMVRDFYERPERYPILKNIFDEAGNVFEGVDFYEFLAGDLSSRDPSLVRIANVLFCYGTARQWIERRFPRVRGITFTSGGLFPGLLLTESLSIREGLPFMKQVFDHIRDFIVEGIYGMINTTGTFQEISFDADRLVLVGAPEWFITDVRNVIPYRVHFLSGLGDTLELRERSAIRLETAA